MTGMKRILLVALALVFVVATVPGCGGTPTAAPVATTAPKAATATPAAADVEFFKGKVVTIVTPHGAGGGFDIYARMIAPFLQKYLPDSTVVVDNVTGAGGLQGRNKVFTAKPDGVTLGFSTGTGMLFAEWAGAEGVEYKVDQFTYLGRIFTEPHVMVVSAAKPYKTLADVIKAKKITMGFSGVGSDDYYVAQIMAKAMGFALDPVTGYTGANEANLSCVKGEVDSVQLTYGTAKALIDAKSVIPIVVYSQKRIAELPDVPTALELTTGDAQKTMTAVSAAFELDRVLFAPPGMAAARTKTLRDAVAKAMADPEFIATSEKAKRPVIFLTGDETMKLLANIQAAADQLKPQVKAIGQANK